MILSFKRKGLEFQCVAFLWSPEMLFLFFPLSIVERSYQNTYRGAYWWLPLGVHSPSLGLQAAAPKAYVQCITNYSSHSFEARNRPHQRSKEARARAWGREIELQNWGHGHLFSLVDPPSKLSHIPYKSVKREPRPSMGLECLIIFAIDFGSATTTDRSLYHSRCSECSDCSRSARQHMEPPWSWKAMQEGWTH